MVIKIRLSRLGAVKKPFYRIVIARNSSPRNGKFLETIGYINMFGIRNVVNISYDRLAYWTSKGAKLTLRTIKVIKNVKN